MIQPRNTLVVVKLIEKAERKVGKLTIPTNSDLYCEGEIVAVGPGSIGSVGARCETFDLNPGQRVLVQHQQVRPGPGGQLSKNKCGIEYREPGSDEIYMIFEQANILAILPNELAGFN